MESKEKQGKREITCKFFLCQFEKPGMCAIVINGLKIMLYSYSEEIVFFSITALSFKLCRDNGAARYFAFLEKG